MSWWVWLSSWSGTGSHRRKNHQLQVEFTHISTVNGKVAAQLSALTISNGTIICENRKMIESCRIFLSQLSTIAGYFQVTISVPEQTTLSTHRQKGFVHLRSQPSSGPFRQGTNTNVLKIQHKQQTLCGHQLPRPVLLLYYNFTHSSLGCFPTFLGATLHLYCEGGETQRSACPIPGSVWGQSGCTLSNLA